MAYAYPLIIVGLGGMINEMLSRVIYRKVLHEDPHLEEFELGVFGANYKLAVLITMFIQVFRLAAEPFFFNQSKHENAQRTYARVMKFFVIACCFMFLTVSLFLQLWAKLIASKHPEYANGIYIVPVLAMGNVFLGIYYNLSVWYKLTNKNLYGAYITLAGAVITIVLNMTLIPHFHYYGAAWATFACYAYMMVANYLQGQRYYPIPYAKKKLLAYLSIALLLFFIHEALIRWVVPRENLYHYWYYGTGLACMGLFTWLIATVEKKELKLLPVIGKFF
jgi:O-antigen/teichoic acid export membrane protein